MSDTKHLSEDSLELSKMFHEIKNPLTFINSSLQLIESDHPEVRDFRFWNQTMEDIQNLRKLIDELSDFQKGTSIHKTKINLFDFTEDLLESTAGFLMQRGNSLTLECSDYDVDFYADEGKLRQAIHNLVKNAVESSESGQPILLQIETTFDTLCICVKDFGCGMNEEQLSKVMEPFHTTKSYGTGLGLPIVKRITDAHGGRLSIDSKEGAGTAVKLLLPLS